ncbi:MAG: hypothetical protein N3F08_05890 [Crenarchaeota archaeon]|nr:hypothetical protein [Thermoproteota archaeon]
MQTKKKIYVIMLVLLATILIVVAYSVWTHNTIIHIDEPFQVESNLPAEVKASPGEELTYYIQVNNKGSTDLMAVLTYTVDPSGRCTITPPSGTWQLVKSAGSVIFEISIKIHGDAPPGEITINWAIERASPPNR